MDLGHVIRRDSKMPNLPILYGIIGAVIGLLTKEIEGALLFAAVGYILGVLMDLKKRMDLLEERFKEIQSGQPVKKAHEPVDRPSAVFKETRVDPGPRVQSETTGPLSQKDFKPASEQPKSTQPLLDIPKAKPEKPVILSPASRASRADDFDSRLFNYIKTFFVQGNVVVRVGLIVLFFGVAFLIKYAADRNIFPIELRLSGVAAGAMAMLIFGWRLRQRQPAYAMLIQGGAIGILYLTVFAAAKIYELVPMGLSFFLLTSLVALSAMLALVQDAMPLAVFGAAGGFLAPVLLSTGAGSHVALFSYYGLLNTGILGIAWFKPWRVLNLVGFAFTFVIGMAWGYKYYHPDYFATTEPFLILFFLIYAAISILYALRQPLDLKGFVDGPLVFGLPLVAFGLQSALVYRYEYGMGISAIALGGFYMGLAKILWNRNIEGMKMLTEAFLAMSVVFASLSIPLALDSTWTSGLWALEGAGAVWVGLRQRRVLARCFGQLLQIGAGISFSFTIHQPISDTFFFNGAYMSCLIISLAGFASNFCLQRFKDRLMYWEQYFHWMFLVWGAIWWFGGGINEIETHLLPPDKAHGALAFIAVSCWLMGWLSLKLKWQDMAFPPKGLAFAAVFILFWVVNSDQWPHPFHRTGIAAWAAAFFAQYYLLFCFEKSWEQKLQHVLHPLTLHLLIFILTWECAWAVERWIDGAKTWELAVWGGAPGLMVLMLVMFGSRMSWPMRRFLPYYTGKGLAPVVTYLFCWTVFSCFFKGNPSPLPYVPIINPLEIVGAFILLTVIKWKIAADQNQWDLLVRFPGHSIAYGVAASAFLTANAMIARTVHAFGGVRYKFDPLFDSVVFQSALSIFWTLFALGIMVGATRKQSRTVWFIGAFLLGIVVVKLFFIDLDDIGTVARIVSFMVVGLLMLVIGYFSPLPPKQEIQNN
jgi:uncharacterized membrane protein